MRRDGHGVERAAAHATALRARRPAPAALRGHLVQQPVAPGAREQLRQGRGVHQRLVGVVVEGRSVGKRKTRDEAWDVVLLLF